MTSSLLLEPTHVQPNHLMLCRQEWPQSVHPPLPLLYHQQQVNSFSNMYFLYLRIVLPPRLVSTAIQVKKEIKFKGTARVLKWANIVICPSSNHWGPEIIYFRSKRHSPWWWFIYSGNTGDDCNFELGICKWKQDTTDKFDWKRHQGTTASAGTGPKYDHTKGTGKQIHFRVRSVS